MSRPVLFFCLNQLTCPVVSLEKAGAESWGNFSANSSDVQFPENGGQRCGRSPALTLSEVVAASTEESTSVNHDRAEALQIPALRKSMTLSAFIAANKETVGKRSCVL